MIVIGGSYSGLSAAMALGRSLRRVLIIDSGTPCNHQTPHSHNFITHDGSTPGEISAKAKSQVLKYSTISFVEDKAMTASKTSNGFSIKTEEGRVFKSKKVIMATGIKDVMPRIKGFSDCWGISIVHCPYCHGYEIRQRKTAIMSDVQTAIHLAPLVRNLTKSLSIITNDSTEFSPEEVESINNNKVRIIQKEVIEIEHENGQLKQLLFSDHSKEAFDAAYASLPFIQHSDIPNSLGCELNDQGYLQVDSMYKTTVDGVFACGDNCSRMRSVANAVASGNIAGAVINMELSNQQFIDQP